MALGFLLLTFACLLLSACDSAPNVFGRLDQKTDSPAESSDKEQTTIAPLKLPPGMEERPPLPGQTGREHDVKGLPMMKPALGMNTDVMLFSENIRDSDDRFERVENAVQELRNDFDSMLPSMLRLVAIEKDINNLVGQLETLLTSDGQAFSPSDMASPPAEAAVIKPVNIETSLPPLPVEKARNEEIAAIAQPPPSAAPTPITPASAPVSVPVPPQPPLAAPAETQQGGIQGLGVRIGTHPSHTRVVFDLSGASEFTADLDTVEKILLVSMPGVRWAGPTSGSANNSIVQSWNVTSGQGGTGTLISFQLQKNAKITNKITLTNPTRAVIDLTPQ